MSGILIFSLWAWEACGHGKVLRFFKPECRDVIVVACGNFSFGYDMEGCHCEKELPITTAA
jgi:hypothetical protein